MKILITQEELNQPLKDIPKALDEKTITFIHEEGHNHIQLQIGGILARLIIKQIVFFMSLDISIAEKTPRSIQ